MCVGTVYKGKHPIRSNFKTGELTLIGSFARVPVVNSTPTYIAAIVIAAALVTTNAPHQKAISYVARNKTEECRLSKESVTRVYMTGLFYFSYLPLKF